VVQQFTISPAEAWYLDTVHSLGTAGVFVLKSLAYLTAQGEGAGVQISRETLARHCGRSVRTVSRAVAKLKALSLIEAGQPSPKAFDCWEANIYRVTPLGLHLAALLGTGSVSADIAARDIGDPLVSTEDLCAENSAKTSAPDVAHADIIEESPQRMPAPSLGPDLEPIVKELERADSKRFAHLRDWITAKLRSGISRRHMLEALSLLRANLAQVTSWAGYVQSRLDAMTTAEHEAEQRRLAAVRRAEAWRERFAGWEEGRMQNAYCAGDLVRLVIAERSSARTTPLA
jgi:hypothetical protein